MAQMNLYLPDALKEEMSEFPQVKWSQIAAESFRRAIEMERKMQVNITEAKLARLRVSRAEKLDDDRAAGVAAGKTWALDHADYDELERVASLTDTNVEPHTLAAAILDDERPDRQQAEELMERLFGRDHPSVGEFEGFIEGANEVFEKV
jgi:hypothetical protein